jgi:hypothetical protein
MSAARLESSLVIGFMDQVRVDPRASWVLAPLRAAEFQARLGLLSVAFD